VGVEAHELDRGRGPDPLGRGGGGAVRQAEAELGVLLAGPHELVGVGFDARRDAQLDAGAGQALGVQGVEAVDLVEAVDDQQADAGG
jgi:hypothetical protein